MPRGSPRISGRGRNNPTEHFEQMYNQHYRVVETYLLRRIGNTADAQDLAADTFLSVWHHIDKLPPEPDIRGFLLCIARRHLWNYWRGQNSRMRRLQLALTLDNFFSPYSADDSFRPFSDNVLHAFSQLRVSERDVLRLVYWNLLSHEEAARALKCSTNALDLRLSRARRSLRTLLSSSAPPSTNTNQATYSRRFPDTVKR